MTSERILLGHCADKGVLGEHVIRGPVERSSNNANGKRRLGAAEQTATIVWQKQMSVGLDSREFVLWNAFAFHPMKGSWLSNRAPTPFELKAGRPLLESFLSLFPDARVVTVGNSARGLLSNLAIDTACHVRHPANGGANAFRAGIEALLP